MAKRLHLGTTSMTLLSIAVGVAAAFVIVGIPFMLWCVALAWRVAVAIIFVLTGSGALSGLCAIFVNQNDSSEQLLGGIGFVLNCIIAVGTLTMLL